MNSYTVSYRINVVGIEESRTAIDQFVQLTKQLKLAAEPFRNLNGSIKSVQNRLKSLSEKAVTIHLKTEDAERKIDSLITKLRLFQEEVRKSGGSAIFGNLSSNGRSSRSSSSRSNNGGSSRTAVVPVASSSKNTIARVMPKNVSYKALGATPMDVGGMGAVSLLKGAGIAYGISSIGSLVRSVVQDAVAYDNSMQTVRNILATHDKRGAFDYRFKGMEHIVRKVGVETKFTAPEVAEAAKFLAMAGFDLEGISQSISPIADIALVGDTELGETADVVTNIMTGYGIAPSRIKNAADVMTMTFTKSNTTLMEMAEAYKYSASLLSMNGTSFEEATAALGILGDAGLKGSQAGTTMRTIALNIAKPTKQQAEMWRRLGVERLDKNGNVRDLYSIFRDLHEKNLSITQLGSLFHKTAAMGAGVLANHVDKWNEIIEQNFLSEGLTERLAEEKKNTLQGVWAQLTSAFTENGIQAFEGVQIPIRDMLQSVISWLKTPEAAETFKTIAEQVLEFLKMMKDVTVRILKVIKPLIPWIQFWLQIQMCMWPVVNTARALKGAITGIGMAIKTVGGFSAFIGFLNKLRLSFIATKNSAGSLWKGLWLYTQKGVGWFGNTIGDYAQSYYFSGVKNRQIAPDVVARWRNRKGKIALSNSQIPMPVPYGQTVEPPINPPQPQKTPLTWGRAVSRGLGMLGSAAVGVGAGWAGSWLGSKIGEEGSMTSMIGSAVGGAAGLSGAWVLTKYVGLLAPLLASVPAAAIAAAAATVYFIWKINQQRKEIEKAIEAHNKYLSSIATLNGISYSKNATEADKYYAIIYNRQLDTNQAISEHIKLVREQLGLIDEAKQKLESEAKFKDSHKEIYENFSKPFGALSDKEDWLSATRAVFQNGQQVPYLTPTLQQQYGSNGSVYDRYKFNGYLYNPSVKNHMSILAAAKLLTAMGHDMSKGSEGQQIRDLNLQRILRSTSMNDYNAVLADVLSNVRARKWIEGSEFWDDKDIGNRPQAELHQGYHYIYGLKEEIEQQFDVDDPKTPTAKLLATFAKIIKAYQSQKDIPEEILQKFLLEGGNDIFNKDRYGAFGSDDWLAHFGYKDGKWNALPWTETIIDENGNRQTVTRNLQAQEAQTLFATFHQKIIDTVKRLNPAIQPYFNSFVNHPVWDLAHTGDQGTGRSLEGQIHKDQNGQYYKYQKGRWYKCDSKGNISRGPHMPIADATFRRENGLDGTITTPEPPPGSNDYSSDYKSNYKNNSAAPKQVIVKIENLMNVESVDLSNPDNKAVIDDLKGQLTQALVDVVHDFDETWHG